MSKQQYKILAQHLSFDKTRLFNHMRPKLYNDVHSANKAAQKWLNELRGEGEVVRVVKTKESGMQVQVTTDWKKQEDISARAEVVQVGEENITEGSVALIDEGAGK